MKKLLLIITLVFFFGCSSNSHILMDTKVSIPYLQIYMSGIEWTLECEDGIAWTIMKPKRAIPNFTIIKTSDGRTCKETMDALEKLFKDKLP